MQGNGCENVAYKVEAIFVSDPVIYIDRLRQTWGTFY